MRHHLHKRLSLGVDDVVEIHLDNAALVFLADTQNYNSYLKDMDYDYYGTQVESFPFRMVPPYEGIWHLVIEQSDPARTVRAHIQVISP